MPSSPPTHRTRGFTTAELLVALAVGAAVISAAAVGFGTFVRAQPKVGSSAVVTLDSARLTAYYGLNQTTVQTVVAPNYGALLRAENLRERFMADTMGATAVYCLYRTTPNTYHPYSIPYDPSVDNQIDRSTNFLAHIIAKTATTGVTATSFSITARNTTPTPPTGATYSYGASIFILGFSPYPTNLIVTAVYDIDVDKVASPSGFYASVKRWSATPPATIDGTAGPALLTDYYDVFYPPSNTATWPVTNDEFAPLWAAFERRSRLALTETVAINRFKVAKDMPFYFIWWPDPALRNLDATRAKLSPPPSYEARQAYYQMGGRTAFMFTVPMFPSS